MLSPGVFRLDRLRARDAAKIGIDHFKSFPMNYSGAFFAFLFSFFSLLMPWPVGPASPPES
jgi:hypothetical protein